LLDVRGRIVLVLDRHPAHVAAATRRRLAKHEDRLVVHFLPAHAPERNPDGHVWSQVKGLFRRTPVLATEDFDPGVENAMIGIARDRLLVRRVCDQSEVAYVKAAVHWDQQMQYTQEQHEQFKATFALRRRRQMIAVVPTVLLAVLIGTADGSSGTTLGGIPMSYALPVAFAGIVGVVLFAFKSWRCPACNRTLGKTMSPSFCARCGVPLR
jgi:transposase